MDKSITVPGPLAVLVPFGHHLVALLDDLPATLYEFAILLKQAVSPPQQLLGSMEHLIELGFDVLRVVVWPRHSVEFLYFGPIKLSM